MICGHAFDDGEVCMQAYGHEKRGVPHLRQEEAQEFWRARHEAERLVKP